MENRKQSIEPRDVVLITFVLEKEVKQMFTFFSSSIDLENLNLDDEKTYELIQNAETDGIYMMESAWDKYDLFQIKPHNN